MDERYCTICEIKRVKGDTPATVILPEPPSGAFGRPNGAYPDGIALCSECAEQWRAPIERDEAQLCEACVLGWEVTPATTTVPEPRRGAFGCPPGTYPGGIPMCEECAAQWRDAIEAGIFEDPAAE
jgi:hypothetical protein